jgi:hypothetical protein
MYQEIDNFDLDDKNASNGGSHSGGGDDGGGGNNDEDGTSHESKAVSNTLSASMIFRVLLYGVVNVIMAVPSMYGYAAVIFRDPAYGNDMASLAKLVCFSSAVHQVLSLLCYYSM